MRGAASALLLGLACLAAAPSLATAQDGGGQTQAPLTEPEAVREIFPGTAATEPIRWTSTAAQRGALADRLGAPPADSAYTFLAAFNAAGRFLGYALVTEERGKYRPITFMVGIAPDLRVRDVAILVYRESRGGEVRSRRFLAQYRGKRAEDPIRVDRDIVNVTGATISARSVSTGVRRVLLLATTAFAGRPAPVPGPGLRALDVPR